MRIDEIGHKYGKYTVISLAYTSSNYKPYWLCRCACGREKIIYGWKLRNNLFTDCHCGNKIDISKDGHEGEDYGNWHIIGFSHYSGKKYYYNCVCKCGTNRQVDIDSLLRGTSKSCGCVSGYKISDYIKVKKKKPYTEAAMLAVFSSYIKNASKKGNIFSLTVDEFKNIINQNCYYCGVSPSTHKKLVRMGKVYDSFVYNGIDRINNSVGYIMDNVVPCCETCNKMKRHYSLDFFLKHINAIHNNLNYKKIWDSISA